MKSLEDNNQTVNILELERTSGSVGGTPGAAVSQKTHDGTGDLLRSQTPTSQNCADFATTNSGVVGGVPSCFQQSQKVATGRRSRTEKLSRRWAWLRGAGSYIYFMQYYGFLGVDGMSDKLERCQHSWIREHRGDKVRWRGVGCGERRYCPVCGSYSQFVLAKEASESMLTVLDAVEVMQGLRSDSYGLKLVLTVRKDISARIDGLLRAGDYAGWQEYVGWFYKEAYKFIEKWFGSGCGGVVSMDYEGESAPGEPHYHLNVYIFPAVREVLGRLKVEKGVRGKITGQRWTALEHWVDKDKITVMRSDWTARINSEFGVDIEDANFKVLYLGSAGQLHHWMRYLYRHPLADLWRGWQGVDGDVVHYKTNKKSTVQSLTVDDIGVLVNRLEAIPAHFKRVRWFGIFSDGVRGETMGELGLEPVDVSDDGDGEKWERDSESARFVRYAPDGVVLAFQLKDNDGNKLWQEATKSDGSVVFRPVLGESFTVPGTLTDYRPSGVSVGKRKRWRPPGCG